MRRSFPPWLLAIVLVLAVTGGVSCLDLSWKTGISCSSDGKCPDGLTCCSGSCQHQCAAPDAASSDGPASVVCPATAGGCFACMPGCACSCGGLQKICCLQAGIAVCASCP